MTSNIRSRVSRPLHGFTLVELLVVIAIIGILVALLLPAVQAAREAARRAQCTNNIKQVALAMHLYHDTHRSLPAGGYHCCYGTWVASILPYIEEAALADQYVWEGKYDVPDDSTRYYVPINLPVTTHQFSALTCPSDDPQRYPDIVFKDITSHNYVVNFGTTGWQGDVARGGLLEVDGVVFRGAPFAMSGWTNVPAIYGRFNRITDGLSKTLMFSEVIQGRGTDMRGLSWWSLGAGFFTFLPPNAFQPDVMFEPLFCVDSDPENPPCIAPFSASRPMTNAARSWHSGGVMVAQCDGSARFVSDDILLDVWRAMSTSEGGEPIDVED